MLFSTVKTSYSALDCPSPSNSPPLHRRRYKCAHKRQSQITYRHCTSEPYNPCALIAHLSIVPSLHLIVLEVHLSKFISSPQKMVQNSQAHRRNNGKARRETTETCGWLMTGNSKWWKSWMVYIHCVRWTTHFQGSCATLGTSILKGSFIYGIWMKRASCLQPENSLEFLRWSIRYWIQWLSPS
jgi:hypothetical protein